MQGKERKELLARVEAARKDPAFKSRRERALKRHRSLLERLAKN